jgi:putative flippase GtrA
MGTMLRTLMPRLGSRLARIRQLVRYSAVSAVSTGTSLTTLGFLVGVVSVPAVIANVLATAVGTVPSFELNRRWVWSSGGPRSIHRQVVPFCALSLVELVVSTVAVKVVAARTAGWSPGGRTLAVELASVAAFGSLWVVQFVVLDRVLFAHRPGATAPGAPPRSGEGRQDLLGEELQGGRVGPVVGEEDEEGHALVDGLTDPVDQHRRGAHVPALIDAP